MMTEQKMSASSAQQGVQQKAQEKAQEEHQDFRQDELRESFVKEPSLIIYGGTFDPPHNGHLECINCVARMFPNSKIIIVPTPAPPAVEGKIKLPEATFEERMHLLGLLLEHSPFRHRITLSAVEQSLPQPHFTWQLLEKVQSDFPDEALGFLLGLDQFMKFDQWRHPLKILEKAAIIAVRRDSSESALPTVEIKKVAEAVFNRLQLSLHWRSANSAAIGTLNSFQGLYVISDQINNASSTMIKRMIKDRRQLPTGWVPEAVESYILRRNFYTKDENE